MAKKASSKKSSSSKKDFLVVGIGASAGGVKALQDFFATMPPNSGMAFVVILHLLPEHESNLPEIIQTQTTMPVFVVNETKKVEPNHVYVIPPDKHLEMVDGIVRATEAKGTEGSRVAIDVFFRTLAENYRENAVCVVLSGAGTDGTMGLKAVKEENGFAIVQNPHDAQYDSMPRSAIATHLADWILPVAEMPEKLLQFRDSSKRLHLTGDEDAKKVAEEIQADESLREILTVLRVRTGHDFSNYKTPTLVRRIARHLQIHDLEDIPAYLEFLRANPAEINSLLKNLLINVTNFFRDKEAWAVLEREVIPHLFEGKGVSDVVRVWSCACASGEEAYSLAMLLSEYAQGLHEPPKIQIFATDVDEDAIAQAREHRYPQSIEADVSAERLKRFFLREGKYYSIRKELREMVLFAPHNVLRDPPFSRLDLIACRNLLIYLNRETQERLMEIFHFALAPNGLLFLGSSETAESSPELFAPLDKKQRIYTRRAMRLAQQPTAPRMPIVGRWEVKLPEFRPNRRERAFALSEVHHKLLEKIAPPSILVSQDFDIQYLSESAGRYLRFKGGEPTNNLLKVIHPDLLPDLRAALFTAQRENKTAEFPNVRALIEGVETSVNLIVRVISVENDETEYLLIIFDENKDFPLPKEAKDKKIARASAAKDEAMEAVVFRLEEELARTKENLRATIEQHEVSIEELKASNEELQAINEELRSTTEELETSKEELQSVNEELTTVNHELKEKIDETSRTNSDLQNLMASTDIATIFLDKNLRIKRYTPPIEEIFNITTSDIRRPLEHFTHRLNYENLTDDAQTVLRRLTMVEREISDRNGNFYLARFVPYRTVDDRIDGVVLNFIDITRRKEAEAALSDSEEKYRTLFDSIDEGFCIVEVMRDEAGTSVDYRILEANRVFERHTGVVKATGKLASEVAPGEEVYWLENYDQVARTGEPLRLENYHKPTKRWYAALLSRVGGEGSRQVAIVFDDITARKRAEEELALNNFRLTTAMQATNAGWGDWNLLTGEADWSEEGKRIIGFESDEEAHTAEGWLSRVHPEDRPKIEAHAAQVFAVHENFNIEYRVVHSDGEIRWLHGTGKAFYDENDVPYRSTGLVVDITERKAAEQALRESEEKYRSLFDSIDEGFCTVEVLFDEQGKPFDYRFLEANPAFERQTGLKDAMGKTILELAPDHEKFWFETYGEIAKTGKPKRFEHVAAALGRFYDVYAFRLGETSKKQVGILFNDIHKRKRAEHLLRENEERTRIAIEAAELGTWEWNLETNEVIWNEQHYLLFGMKPQKEPHSADDFFSHVHPDDRARVTGELKKAVEEKGVFDTEFCAVLDDGSTRWMSGYGRVTEERDGKPVRMSGVMFDITAQKKAQEALRKSEEHLQLILESTKDYAIITFDLSGMITRWNKGAERIFGWTEKEALGQTTHLIFTPEDRDAGAPEKELKTTLKKGRAEDERWHLRKDGSRFFASGVMQLLRDGRTEGFVKIARDQTARLEAEQMRYEQEMLRRMVAALEDERRRIARDLHDHLGQQLTVLRLKLDGLKNLCDVVNSTDKAEAAQTIADVIKASEQIDRDVDFIARELRPTALDDLGLRAALADFVRDWSNYTGIKTEFHTSGLARTRIDREIETNLYRIAQEALNNIHKHAQASQVSVLLEKIGDKISLIIEDDGIGFNPKNKANRKKGMGLVGMHERARLSGGDLEIESAKGKGTTVFARIPLKK